MGIPVLHERGAPLIDERIAEKSAACIREHAKGERPFFLFVSWSLVHHPYLPHPDFAGWSGNGAFSDVVVEPDDRVIDGLDQSALWPGDTDHSARESVLVFSGRTLLAVEWRSFKVVCTGGDQVKGREGAPEESPPLQRRLRRAARPETPSASPPGRAPRPVRGLPDGRSGLPSHSCEHPGVNRGTLRVGLLILVSALVVLYVVAEVAAHRMSSGPLRTLIEKNLSQALGLDVSIDEAAVALLPTPHLHVEGVRIGNPPGRSSPQLLSIESLDLGIALWPLLHRIVSIDQLTVAGADLHLETDDKGRMGGDFELGAMVADDDPDSLHLELRRLDVERLRVSYRDDRSGASHTLVMDAVTLDSADLDSGIALEARGEFEGSGIALSGRIGSLRELLKPSRPFPVDLAGQLFEAKVGAKGTVREIGTLAGLDLEVSAEIPELVVHGQSLPQLGALRLAGHLSGLDGSLGLESFRLNASKTEPVRIDVRGRIGDLLELKQVDVDARVDASSLDFLVPLLQPLLDFPVPAIASLSVRTKLSDGRDGLDLDGTMSATTPGNAIALRAEGGVGDLLGASRIDVSLDARADDLASITALFPELPVHEPLGPVTASARLASRQGVLGASGIRIHVGSREKVWADLDGSIGDVVSLHGVALELVFGAASLHHLKELLARELPRTPPFAGSAALDDGDGSLGLEHVHLHGGENGPVEIHLDGRFDDLPARDEIEIELGLKGQDTHVLGALAGLDLPVVSPVEFHGTLEGSDEHLEARDASLRLGETRLLGSLSGSFVPHARPAVKARITSKNVRLQDLGMTPSNGASVAPAPKAAKTSIDPGALPFEELRRVDLDLDLQLDRVRGYVGFDSNDVRLDLDLRDGNLLVKDLGASYQGGQLHATMQADARTPLPRVEIGLQTDGIDLTRVISQFQENTEYSGTISADVDLAARGRSFDALRRSLAGRVAASIRDGSAVSRITREFVVNLADTVFPGLRTSKHPNIGCGVARLQIEDGIATVDRLFLKEKEVSLTGTGRIDLVSGRYDLHVVPTTTRPGIVGVAPEVDVSGPLDDPVFHPVKRTLVTSFGRGLLQNAIGAGSMLLRPFGVSADPTDEPEVDCPSADPGPA